MVQPPEGPPVEPEPIGLISVEGVLTLMLLIPGAAVALLGSNPLTTVISQSLKKALPAEIPDPATTVVMRLKAAIDQAGYEEIMLRHGFSPDIAVQILNASETILTPAELVNANYRGIIDDERYTDQMLRQGFSPEAVENFKELSRFVAGPTDLVRFAVREVFTPKIVAELGLADEFPSEFVEAVATWGMSPETAEDFWKAHWVLPSIGQGFEMLHRRAEKPGGGTFEIEDMNRLLRIQDVMPFFRDLLTQIAFRPFTRVDVRRMHKMGVLNADEVKSAYMDIGFDDEKATAMTEFTIQFNTEGDRDLTKSEILRALDRRVIDEDLAIIILDEIGLSFEAASVIVATHQAKVAMDLTDELSDIEIDRFIDGLISEDELMDTLALLDLTAGQLEVLMAKARKRRRRAEKMPSKADILRWHIAEIIDRETADTLLDRIGIREEFRTIYLQETVEGVEE